MPVTNGRRINRPPGQHATDDVARQLEALVHPGYLTATPLRWLQHFPRYLKGISYRYERLTSGALDRDRQGAEQLEAYLALYDEVAAEHHELEILDPELTVFRWMLEEYRISLFAQPLGTQMPVSPQRLDKQFARIRR
jgi:ATP-dependent helicase HrpA